MSASQKLLLECLQEYKAKPILPLELRQIQRRLSAHDASVEHFKYHYTRDPIFCIELVQLAWQATQKRATQPFAADQAMNTIGIGGANAYFKQLKLSHSPKISDEVKLIMSASVLAAEIIDLHSDNKALYWSALLHQLPDIMLWHLHPKSMWRIFHRQNKRASKLRLFEESKLGFNLPEWRMAVANEYHLSEINKQTFAKTLPETPKQLVEYSRNGYSTKVPSLKAWHRTQSWDIVIASWLARSIMMPSYANSQRHYQQIAQQAWAMSASKINQLVCHAVRQSSEILAGSQLYVPAANWLMNRSKPPLPQWLVKPPVAHNVRLKQAKNSLQTFVLKLKTQPHSFSSSAKMIAECLRHVSKHLNYDRACLLSVDRKNLAATTKLALAHNNKTPIKPVFNFKPLADNSPSPLQALIEKPGAFVFQPTKHKKLLRFLPEAIVNNDCQHFILYALKTGNQVKVLLYLDSTKQQLFQKTATDQLKFVLACLNHALLARDQIKKQQAS
jgi:hypothetical protein